MYVTSGKALYLLPAFPFLLLTISIELDVVSRQLTSRYEFSKLSHKDDAQRWAGVAQNPKLETSSNWFIQRQAFIEGIERLIKIDVSSPPFVDTGQMNLF